MRWRAARADRSDAALAHRDGIWTEWSDRRSARPVRTRDREALAHHAEGVTFAPTGGMVAAAAMTSCPELAGGVRNWDYRFCWLRDPTFMLFTLLSAGYQDEARPARLAPARVAGAPEQLQILYGIAGERRLTEVERYGSPATRTAGPCASATSRRSRCSSTFTARSSPPLPRAGRAGLMARAAGRLERQP